MGASSSLLDEHKSNVIKGKVDAEFINFAPIYKKQFSLAYLSQIQDELEQRKEEHKHLLKQKAPPEPGDVLYEEHVLYFEDGRKWKQRFLVVRASYYLECHESYETFTKGVQPLHRLLPTGGTILTTEETYMEMVNKCCPYVTNAKEDFLPPESSLPGQFPVYLRLPYRRDPYFCFRKEEKQDEFISILSDCIRHQNKDFLKKKTCEVQAFLKALQLYRQEKGQYESWDMLVGSDTRVLANLMMEDLMPYLEKEVMAKKPDKRKTWFATVEAAYYLVQEHLLERLTALKEECKEMVKQQGALMRSDMDQIISSREFLEGKLRAVVSEPAREYCTEHVQPYLPAILEEVMVPISLGFAEARELSEGMMDQMYEDFKDDEVNDDLREALVKMSNANLQSCYEKVSGLTDHIQELQQTFNYSTKGLEDSTEIDIQQLMENVAYTYKLLLRKALEDPSVSLGMALEKAKHRVLKQFDYDSSTVRKRILHEALINITLPSMKKHLAPSFKEELPNFEQYIFADYSNFISVDNVYEDILQQILEKDVSMVVKEAASMQKYNLFTDSKYHFSLSSLSSTPPGSPAHLKTPPSQRSALPPSPLLTNGLAAKQSFASDLEPIKSETTVQSHIAPSQAEPISVPVMAKADLESKDMPILEESADDSPFPIEKIDETTPATEALAISSPAVMVTEAIKRAGNSSVKGSGAAHSDLPKKPVVVISPVSMATPNTSSSSCGGEHVLTEPPAGEEGKTVETEAWSDDTAPKRAPPSDDSKVKNTYPIAVCLSIQDAEAGIKPEDVLPCQYDTKPTDIQHIIHPEKSSEFQLSSYQEDESRPLDCIKAIRDLVVEVIEIEEAIQPQNGKDNREQVKIQMLEEPEAVV